MSNEKKTMFPEQDIHSIVLFHEHEQMYARCRNCHITWKVVIVSDGVDDYLELECLSLEDPLLCIEDFADGDVADGEV